MGYAVALSMGQLLFKLAAPATKVPDFATAVRGLLMSPAFVGGALLYAALMFFWTWLLGRVPLNYAYPMVALCFVLVPLMSWLVFGERAGRCTSSDSFSSSSESPSSGSPAVRENSTAG